MYCYISGDQFVNENDYCGYAIVQTTNNFTIYSTAQRAMSELTDVGESQVSYSNMTLDQRLQRERIKAAIILQNKYGAATPTTTVYIDDKWTYDILTNLFIYYQHHGWYDSAGNKVPNDDLLRIYYNNYWYDYKELNYVYVNETNNANSYMMQLAHKLAECSLGI